MKQFKLHSFFIALASITLLASSCHKDKIEPTPDKPTAQRAGIYVLNQGGAGHNNSTLTYYNYTTKSLVADQFSAANSSTLGDIGNDLGIYGSKMYIVVNNSDAIYVTNPKTAKQVKKITLNKPRSIVFNKNYAFVTSYDGAVAVIDTASLTITKTITVGADPEQMAIANGKLYVANSGGLLYPDPPTNTLSVIDLNTLTEIKKITVQVNPVAIAADSYNNIYVLSLGDFVSTPAGMTVVDATTDQIKSEPAVNLGYNVPIYAQGDYVYYPTTTDNTTYQIAVYNTKTQTLSSANFITDGTAINTPYSISGDPLTGEIFVGDAKDYSSDGSVVAFDKTGKKEYSITAGINPGKIVLVNK